MSAIDNLYDASRLIPGIRQYRSACKVLVHSHKHQEPIVITSDVYAVSTSKTINGPGQSSITLTSARNYLNYLYPNDYINVYFDMNDGSGWTRTFFGYIDRIEEVYQVGSDGVPSTYYAVACTDFSKAFDKTSVVFRPQIAGRADFVGQDFAASNIGGLALQAKGIALSGSPAEIVQNIILVTMGFGSQLLMPNSYKASGLVKDMLRYERLRYITGRLGAAAQEAIIRADGKYDNIRNNLLQQAAGIVKQAAGKQKDISKILKSVEKSTGFNLASKAPKDQLEVTSALADAIGTKTFSSQNSAALGVVEGSGANNLKVLENILAERVSLLDVLDIFSFVERTSIDGYSAGISISLEQGPISNIMRSFQNEHVNEMFFDLRPMSLPPDGDLRTEKWEPSAGEYYKGPDDAGGNQGPDGVCYVPALVMREYPFSTVGGLDATDIKLGIEDGNYRVGYVHFGAIFSDNPNVPGRHVLVGPNINYTDLQASRNGGEPTIPARRHLDVAVIHESEVISTSLGRSDHEHFNWFEMYDETAVLGQQAQYYMNDVLPLISQIHIQQHGLRQRTLQTRFTRFSEEIAESTSFAKDEKPAPGREPPPAEAPQPEAGELKVVARGDIVAPCAGKHNPNSISKWGYRTFTNRTYWKFHHGLDIQPPTPHTGTPIFAIADGEVVISAPEGVWSGYGDVIVIKHKFSGISYPLYSVYAHLAPRSRLVGWGLQATSGTPSDRNRYSSKGAPSVPSAAQEPVPVRKGQQIATMGNTGISSATHLHFEIDKHFPPKATSGDPVPTIEKSVSPTVPATPTSLDPTGQNMTGKQRSCDPVSFYSAVHGVNFVASLSMPTPQEEEDASDQGDTGGQGEPSDDIRPKEDVLEEAGQPDLTPPKPASVSTGVAVDSKLTRSQIIRWSLLQDHWYQHNLEYLSGRIDMRGAPEIRVGYRLDFQPRYLSFYVESVNHTWQYPDRMVTSLQVTRGQPNNPFPLYVAPSIPVLDPATKNRRTDASRLASYFVVPDPVAVRRALVLSNGSFSSTGAVPSPGSNVVDSSPELYLDERVFEAGYEPPGFSFGDQQEPEVSEDFLKDPPAPVGIKGIIK